MSFEEFEKKAKGDAKTAGLAANGLAFGLGLYNILSYHFDFGNLLYERTFNFMADRFQNNYLAAAGAASLLHAVVIPVVAGLAAYGFVYRMYKVDKSLFE
jgi:hypothetical protein